MALQPLLTTQEICDYFSIVPRTLLNWRNDKDNPFPAPLRKGNTNRWKQSDVESYIDSLTVEAA